jgi:uncharacterized protein DUF3175
MKSVILVPATLNQRLGGMRVPATGKGTDRARRRFPLKRQGVEHGWSSEIGACAQVRNTQNRRQKCKSSASRQAALAAAEIGRQQDIAKALVAARDPGSDALDLQQGVFKLTSPEKIAASLKRSAERSSRRKAGAYRSALSMLTFYINRAGKALPKTQRDRLQRAKTALRHQFHRE